MEDYCICVQRSTDTDIIQNNSGQKAVFKKSALWPKGYPIKIGFDETNSDGIKRDVYNDNDIDPLQHIIQATDCKLSLSDIVKKVIIERFQPLVNLTFKFVPYNQADIRITFDTTKGTYSCLGTEALDIKKNENTMNFGWFRVSSIIHEFGHAIGMEHEHQSPYSTINWDKQKVYDYFNYNFKWDKETVDINIINKLDEYNFNASKFDPLSIMIYFYPPELTLDNVGTRENRRLSGYDVEWIAKTYPKEKSDPYYISPEKFYYDTYGISLAASKAESDRLAKKSLPWWIILLIIFFSIIFVMIIAFVIKKFYINKNHGYQQLDRRNIPRENIPLNRPGYQQQRNIPLENIPLNRGNRRGIMGIKDY